MKTSPETPVRASESPRESLERYPLMKALRERRSRRFAAGMRTDVGPLAFTSRIPPQPLSEEEEASLAFAACGITGHAAADLVYERGQGGTMMAGFAGRTAGSPDAVQGVALAVINDRGAWILRRPRDFSADQLEDLIELSRRGQLVELYRRCRVRIADTRPAPPLKPPFNIDCNQWDLYAKGTTYFLPVNDITPLYLNVLLELFNPSMALFVVDERAGFRPAGLAPFGKSRGGHLLDDPGEERTLTVERLESTVRGVLQIEQGMMLQNLGLMAQAIGLGGFPNFAGHEFAWFDALGFRTQTMSGLAYLGAGRFTRWLGAWTGRDHQVRFPVGLERDGEPILRAYCPPWFDSMAKAVAAMVERKFGRDGLFGRGVRSSAWSEPEKVAQSAPRPDPANVEAVVAYCEYLHRRYGRFPAYPAPFLTSVGFQAAHLDPEFYDRHYRPEILSETQRRHQEIWHPDSE